MGGTSTRFICMVGPSRYWFLGVVCFGRGEGEGGEDIRNNCARTVGGAAGRFMPLDCGWERDVDGRRGGGEDGAAGDSVGISGWRVREREQQ